MHAPRELGQVVVTLRAYQVWPDSLITRKSDPAVTTPSVFVAESSCTTGAVGCTFVANGPDLAVPEPPTAAAAPATVRAGSAVTFPVSPVTVTNIGNRDAITHKIGSYISAQGNPALLPRNTDGTIKECPGTWLPTAPTDCAGLPYTRLITSVDAGPTDPGSAETITSQSLTIPVDIPPLFGAPLGGKQIRGEQ